MRTSEDSALGGALKILQHEGGYRFSLDPLLLADFVAPAEGAVVELGTGSGVMALALALRSPRARVTALELQPRLAELAARNVALNGLSERVLVREADLRNLEGLLPPQGFDLVASNPPFQPRGRVSPSDEKALARHELTCTLSDVVGAAKRLLRDGGRLALIYPAERLAEVLAELRGANLSPSRLRLVHPRLDEPARLFLVEALRARKGRLEVLPPLALHQAGKRDYTPEAARILGEPERG